MMNRYYVRVTTIATALNKSFQEGEILTHVIGKGTWVYNDGEYRDIAHPINSETREKMQSMILDAYEKAMETSEEESQEVSE